MRGDLSVNRDRPKMIESIFAELLATDFDFRQFAAPSDPLSHLLDDWVPYYRLKFAIAKAVQPKSILEIGVRYGYSAITFLRACPDATYVGIDLEVDAFGGCPGALDWARKITQGYDAKFLIADTQLMKRFPDGIYDLIHVDGQQDGGGTFHDLRRAISQARWVLLDGYFWTQENFVNSNDFLLKYKDCISYAITIPGYAGELLIRTSDSYLQRISDSRSAGAAPRGEIADFCALTHHRHDCGGHEDFKHYQGRSIEDLGLLSLLALTRLARGRGALNVGCGRGEIVYQLAANGFDVTAVGYSAASIEIAKSCLKNVDSSILNRVSFHQAGAMELDCDRHFDLVIAADLIEHLSAGELDHLYETISKVLTQDGVFIIHTAPNAWFYRRGYYHRKQLVEKLGGYMPAEPRTRYELLLHINEQSPANLKRQLSKFFSSVRVWPANTDAPSGSLGQRLTIRQLVDYRDIYAIASFSPCTNEQIRAVLVPVVLSDGEHAKIKLFVEYWPEVVTENQYFSVPTIVTNRSRQMLSPLPPNPVRVSYHWRTQDGAAIVFNGTRTTIPFGLGPGETCKIDTHIQAPRTNGSYILEVTAVQEGCAWFEDKPGFRAERKLIRVVSP